MDGPSVATVVLYLWYMSADGRQRLSQTLKHYGTNKHGELKDSSRIYIINII